MGMYSTYMQDNIQILDTKKLKLIGKSFDTMCLINEEGEINFDEWSGHKLEGYWYDSTREILKAIAPFIKGYVEFSYEEGYPFRIEFRDGKIFYKRGAFDWDEIEETEFK